MRVKITDMKRIYRYLSYLLLALGLALFISGIIYVYLFAHDEDLALYNSIFLLLGGGVSVYASFLGLKALKKPAYFLHTLISSLLALILNIANFFVRLDLFSALYCLIPFSYFILTYKLRKDEGHGAF